LVDLEEIIKKCKKNDQQAQAALYNWLAPKLLGLCVRYFKDRSEAEDVMQDSLVKIFMNIDSYRFEGSFEGWCKRIAVNTTLNRLKVNNRMQFDRDLRHIENAELTEQVNSPVNEQDILLCLDRLPDGYRTILNLFLYEDFSHREIAERLKISESTSRSQYTRARQLLTKLVKERIKEREEKFAE
jgi:RNA polymerase sigma-70 factor (ECF subfamily)